MSKNQGGGFKTEYKIDLLKELKQQDKFKSNKSQDLAPEIV